MVFEAHVGLVLTCGSNTVVGRAQNEAPLLQGCLFCLFSLKIVAKKVGSRRKSGFESRARFSNIILDSLGSK